MNPSWSGKKYHEVTFIGTHNSYSVYPKFQKSVQNQFYDLTTQLKGGVDMLDLEIRKIPLENRIITCHGPALVSGFTGHVEFQDCLQEVKTFVQANPHRVITIYCNYEGSTVGDIWVNDLVKQAFEKSGLDKFVYSYNDQTPPGFTDWPYLEDMICSKKTVMVFGLVGKQDFKQYQNFIKKDGKIQEAWRASCPEDLDIDQLVLPPYDPTKLFLMNMYASPRMLHSWPYLFGGNPHTASIVNQEKVGPLLEYISRTQFVNWIWIDFWTPETLLARP